MNTLVNKSIGIRNRVIVKAQTLKKHVMVQNYSNVKVFLSFNDEPGEFILSPGATWSVDFRIVPKIKAATAIGSATISVMEVSL